LNLFDTQPPRTALPNVICVGAEKSGSTALYDSLRAHPDVYMSPIKETNFFSTDVRVANFRDDYQRHEAQKSQNLEDYFTQAKLRDRWGAYLQEPAQYLRLFADGGQQCIRGEVSNSYLYSATAAQNIADSIPDVRILVMLREPVARAFSQYRAMVRDGRTAKDSLIEEIRYDEGFADRRWGSCHGYVGHGQYAAQLERLFAVFPADRIKVVLAEDFFASRAEQMAQIFDFIGLDNAPHARELPNRNRSAAPRNAGLVRLLARTGLKSRAIALVPGSLRERVKGLFFTDTKVLMTPAEAEFLAPFFVRDVPRVEQLLGRSLDAWRVHELA
jgi:hypothetical protein